MAILENGVASSELGGGLQIRQRKPVFFMPMLWGPHLWDAECGCPSPVPRAPCHGPHSVEKALPPVAA